MAYLIDSEWQAISKLTGISIGSDLNIQNAGRAGDLVELIISDLEPASTDRGDVIRSLDPRYSISGQDSEVWIRYIRYDLNCTITPDENRRCLVNISDTNFIAPAGSGSKEEQERILKSILYDVFSGLIDSNQQILTELKLLNARYEEATETRIIKGDISHAD